MKILKNEYSDCSVTASYIVTIELKKQIEEIARNEHTSASKIAKRALLEYIERHTNKKSKRK